ncbi:unnamed protein product, partial [Prorocentrum cordatum]
MPRIVSSALCLAKGDGDDMTASRYSAQQRRLADLGDAGGSAFALTSRGSGLRRGRLHFCVGRALTGQEEIAGAAAADASADVLRDLAAGARESETKLLHVLGAPLPRQFEVRRPFLMMVLQKFMEALNLRAVRRSLLFEFYTNNALALVGGARSFWFLEDIHVHSGAAVKGDGNEKLATIIQDTQTVDGDGAPRRPRRARPFTNVHAWTGIDGALLKPAVAMKTGDWPDLKADMGYLLDAMAANRSSAGLPPQAMARASHSTDACEKHRKLLQSLYQSKFPSLRFRAHPETPKGKARECSAAAAQGPGAVVTGEPAHCFFEVRRLLPCIADDAEIFLADYADAIARLSAACPPPRDDGAAPPRDLEQEAEILEKSAGQLPPTFWQEAALGPVNARRARGALARVACLCGAQLDSSAPRSNYRTAKAFKRQAEVVQGARSVIAKKVRDHFRRVRAAVS